MKKGYGICLLLCLLLTGCGAAKETATIQKPEIAEKQVETQIKIPENSEEKTEYLQPSITGSVTVEEKLPEAVLEEKKPETTVPVQAAESEEKPTPTVETPTTPVQQLPAIAQTEPSDEAAPLPPEMPSEPPIPSEPPAPAEPPAQEPVDQEAVMTYARSYAVSIGLSLHPDLTESWDMPIIVSPNSKNTERTIADSLLWYQSEGTTAVWFWWAELGSGTYEFYIGRN